MIEKGITNRGPKKRDAECYELQHAIIIPKGTILRQEFGGAGVFDCPVAGGKFSVQLTAAMERQDVYKRVIA